MPRQIKLDLIDQEFAVKGLKTKRASQARRILNKNKIASELNTKKINSGIYDILTKIGVTIDALDQSDFSFKNDMKNVELLQNPNILQKKSFSKLKNEKVNIRDKFSNEDDPFYELDEPRDSINAKIQTIDLLDKDDLLSDITNEILSLNLSNDKVLKQFRSLE